MNRKILEEIIESLEEREVVSASIGYFSTAVVSDGPGGRRCGLATTLRGGACAGPVPSAGSLAGRPVREIARLTLAGGGPGASLGMAAMNSALSPADCEEANAEALLAQRGAGKNVAVIGHFPFTDRLRALARELWVFELEPKDHRDLPPERMAELLPRADVLALTALTLLNGTFGEIMSLCRTETFKLVLGPSAPLSHVLLAHGVDAVGGTRVEDIPALLRALGEGANFRGLPGKKAVVLRKK
ncbi:MAG: Rossmann-like domain-containing protein [Elusimicrobiales bacterium]